MAQWGNTDDAANSVSWAIDGLISNNANTLATQTTLFGNTTVDEIRSKQIIGQFGVDSAEAQANGDIPHAGWVLRTVGTGGRVGRVQHEVLVAMSSIGTDAADDTVLPDYNILITAQPVSYAATNAVQDYGNVLVATVNTAPTGNQVDYVWEVSTDGSSGWVTATTGGNATYTGATGTVASAPGTINLGLEITLGGDTSNPILDNTGNQLFYRLVLNVASGGGAQVISNVVTITLSP
jgi:hypothetical protein